MQIVNCKLQTLVAAAAFALGVAIASSPALAGGWRSAGSSRLQVAARSNPLRSGSRVRLVAAEEPALIPAGPSPMRREVRVAQADDPFDRFFDDPGASSPASSGQFQPEQPQSPEYAPVQRDPFEEDFADELSGSDDQPQSDASEPEFPEPSTDDLDQQDTLPESYESPSPPEPESDSLGQELQEAQEAVERELQRRESEQGVESELPLENPFGEESTEGKGLPEDAKKDADQEALDRLLELLEQEDESGDLIQIDDEARRRLAEQRRREELARQRVEANDNCAREFQKLRADSIDTIDLSIRVEGEPGADFPFECGLGNETFSPRSWSETTYLWKASGLCHKPLYFEQVQLERYGHSWGPCLQPIMSGAHFFMTLPILPYKMGIRTPNECVYTLGYYRPGSCAPYMIDPVPFTWRAAAFEAGAWTAGAITLP